MAAKHTNSFYLGLQKFVRNLPATLRQAQDRTNDWLREPANRRRLLRWSAMATGIAIGVFFLLSLLVYWGVFGKLPSYANLQAIQNQTAAQVFSEDGATLGKYYIQNRINASAEEIPPVVMHALVATEDARFFEHRGIDLRAWLRVLVKSVLLMDESAGGGSTLSQQLAKNLYPRQRYWLFSTLINKMKETFTARRLERTYSKEQLLHLYLNTVPFGEGVYGIKVAAQRYFGVAPQKLKTEQAAVLIGMLKANTYYNPVRNPENALARRNVVLTQMERYGYLKPAISDSLKQLPLKVEYHKEGHNDGLATYFREHLRRELETILRNFKKPDGTPYNLYTDGLRIYTTLNSRMQRYAEEAVQEHLSKLQTQLYEDWRKRQAPWEAEDLLTQAMKRSARYQSLKKQGYSDARIEEIFTTPVPMRIFSWEKGEEERTMSPLDSLSYYLSMLNTGFLAAEPSSGLVRAWVGGIDYRYFQYDHVKSHRQIGSTIKPVVYAAALAEGMLPCEYTANEQVTYTEYKNWRPRNADNTYGGVYSMEGALSRSVNAVSVEIILRAGIGPVRELARKMGIAGSIPNEPSIALGTPDASLYEMVQVYGTFANRGRRPSLHYLDRIETADGQVIVQFKRPDPKSFPQVLNSKYADVITKMMQAVVDSGTARRLRYEYSLWNDIAGKTGTTQNNSDGWFLGYTPKLVAGAWVGAETPQVHFRSTRLGQGGYAALPIWGRFMRKVYKDKQLRDWHYGKFAPLPDSVAVLLQCPHFLPEMPLFANDFELSDSSGFFQRLFQNLRKNDEAKAAEYRTLPERRPGESDAQYTERLQRGLPREEQRDERREKRKEFWSKVLFGKEESDKKNNN